MNYKTIFFLLTLVLACSCQKQFDKFERPDWLEGKVYTQLLTVPGIDSFLVAVRRSGYDTILNTSGSYTVFAPGNAAFLEYLAASPEYSSVSGIPLGDVRKLVKTHIIQNPWSRSQLQMLDVDGWIDVNDPLNNEPWGYKRQTLLRDPDRKYFVDVDREIVTIVDSSMANDSRIVFSGTRKHMPIFYDEYMRIAGLSNTDFDYFFGRDFEAENIYFADARLAPEDYFAENGFIYVVDRVVKPLYNAEQLLERKMDGSSYSTFLSCIHLFPTFNKNLVETNKQEGADQGREVPDLYDLDYNQLVFDIHEELTGRYGAKDVSTSIRYHYGLVAPDNSAMQELIDNVITDKGGYPHYPTWTYTPENIKRIIVNTHMSDKALYLQDLQKGFLNGEGDRVVVDENNITERIYASNTTFYGLDEAIIPRAFSSVTGPVYLRPGYSIYMNAIEYTNVLPAFKRKDAEYCLFVLSDAYMDIDSSMYFESHPLNPRVKTAYSYNKTDRDPNKRPIRRDRTELTIQLMNQIGTRVPSEVPRKEFIENLAGNYIVYNSEAHPETGGPTITGGVESVFGYLGDSTIYVTPVQLEEPTDNGKTYTCDGWLRFPTAGFFDIVSQYETFYNLMIQAGYVDLVFYKFNFISETEFFTVFLPTDEALAKVQADTLSREDLREFINYHFVRGELIFTDGYKPSGDYETLRVDESSTVYEKVYSTLDVRTGLDVISVYDDNDQLITEIIENGSTTNIMSVVNTSNVRNLDNYVTNRVIHLIDTVFIKQ